MNLKKIKEGISKSEINLEIIMFFFYMNLLARRLKLIYYKLDEEEFSSLIYSNMGFIFDWTLGVYKKQKKGGLRSCNYRKPSIKSLRDFT